MAQYVGTVIGTKMDKTAKVLVTRMVLYRKLRKVAISLLKEIINHMFNKYFNEKKVYFAHDEDNECTRGDLVLIKGTQKISKRKAFTVSEILERAPKVIDEETGEVHIQDNRE